MLQSLLLLFVVAIIFTSPWLYRTAYNHGWRKARAAQVVPARCRAPIDGGHERCVGLAALACQDVLCIEHCVHFHRDRCVRLLGPAPIALRNPVDV